MLYLTELSVPLSVAVDVTILNDPLVSSDIDYCVKTWMAVNPELACRPWRKTVSNQNLRITGWRRNPPGVRSPKVFVGIREVSVQAGQNLALSGRFVALRRAKQYARDAAIGWSEPTLAYKGWLTERLIDLLPYATINAVAIDRFVHKHVLRKVDHHREMTRVQNQTIPEVFANISITAKDPLGVEAWMLKGLGPQKAFGYGAFLPVIDLMESIA